jgi:hypothetical protein
MKRFLVLAVCIWFAMTGMAMAALFGPVQPAGKSGTLSFGPGIMAYSGEFEGDVEFEQILAYLQAGYAFTDNFEIYLQGGAADLTVDGLFGNNDFEDGFRPFGAAGFKALLADRKPVAIGIFAQGSYFSDYKDNQGGAKFEFTDNYEVAGGVAFQGEVEGAVLYGGPFFFMRETDAQRITPPPFASDTVEEDGNFGAFIGVRWPLKSGVNVELEGQYRTDFSIGANILYRF